ncbi:MULTISPECIES: response regulator transcription factor [unclassified Paenibacillus]|uniref:response regulator n=1 Tax=unclassified Paenibacillus TaxID=185978 RepID=UPI0003E22EE0|nr:MULTISPECIES: response regulator transcription factor [unclassified Paenibacillus]ETT32935.1 chemotaxis protein CheY [Paenibacillus sp. FSL R7-269]OMG00842.1 DNA-binding response regulator [Paenibacillus sp. FSL R7-0337]
MNSYKILIVDDHMVVREGLKMILETDDRFEIAGEAENGQAALRLIDELSPDVVLLDLNMPVMSGEETLQALKARHSEIPVIILTTYNEDGLMINALALGAKGYLLKDTSRDELFRTIESAIRGSTLLQADILTKVFAAKERSKIAGARDTEPVNLTDKELLILQLVARGFKSKEIAFDMGVTERTIKSHLTNIYSKLGVESRAQAVATAIEQGILHI